MSDAANALWRFRWWRFRVCLIVQFYHHHWPRHDIGESDWLRDWKLGRTPMEEFLEGWCE